MCYPMFFQPCNWYGTIFNTYRIEHPKTFLEMVTNQHVSLDLPMIYVGGMGYQAIPLSICFRQFYIDSTSWNGRGQVVEIRLVLFMDVLWGVGSFWI